MSFSSQAKEELSKINNLANKETVKIELIGYLISSNTNVIKNNKIKYSTESEYNINRFAKLLNNVNILDYDIQMQGKLYVITVKLQNLQQFIDLQENRLNIKEIEANDENIKALIRGAFLGAGSINDPTNKYHLEINLSNENYCIYIINVLNKFDIKTKKLQKKTGYSLYIKEGEEISKFLAFIGANKAVLQFEDIRVQREMNNKVNRLVNCETANLNKTINASVEQINAIQYLQKTHQFEKLNEGLKEIAVARLENPDLPLSELGKLLKNPIGKSGVNYRLKKIVEIANEK